MELRRALSSCLPWCLIIGCGSASSSQRSPSIDAVADALGVQRFLAVGVSTGGAYALALAALAPDRVRGVVTCCAMSDMRHQPSRDTMSKLHCHDVWNAVDRTAAIEAARAGFGDDGSQLMNTGGTPLCPADIVFI